MRAPSAAGAERPVRVARIITRLNIGGPAIQAITLTRLLEPLGYRTMLVRGRENPSEGSMDYLADVLGVAPVMVRWLRRDPGMHDALALPTLVRHIRRSRPHIVHTHLAKAGILARLATLLAFRGRRRPLVVHTYHGHSLTGYLSSAGSAAFLAIERFLARRTDRLIAVSEEVRDELVALGVAPVGKLEVVRLGLDLSRFTVAEYERDRRRARLRAELGIAPDARVVSLVGRLVPIKRIDRFLRIARLLSDQPDVCFLIVGDGELRHDLRASPEARALGDRVTWTGFRRDMPDVYFASDLVVQTSDNEGTPVALIEAHAAGVPVVTTKVGGVSTVVLEGRSGHIAATGRESEFVEAVGEILADEDRARVMGSTGQRHVLGTFSLDRLVSDIEGLYRRLLDGSQLPVPSVGNATEP